MFCTPEHPQSNGQAEKMMTSVVKVTHAAKIERKDPKTEMTKFLRNYWNTPHSSTGKKPSELVMNKDVRTNVSMLISAVTKKTHREAKENDRDARRRSK